MALDDPIRETLRHGHRSTAIDMLPENGDQAKHKPKRAQPQRNLRHLRRREGLDLALRPILVNFYVPSGKRDQENKAHEGQDNSDESVRVRSYPHLDRVMGMNTARTSTHQTQFFL